jgi:hypothetical protein
MSSQHHKNLAAVWIHLQDRIAISSILREVIGQHALHDVFEADELQTETILWVKTIYDLQRCYLCGVTTGLSDILSLSSSHLLPPDLLLSSILYLISIKGKSFSSQTTLLTNKQFFLVCDYYFCTKTIFLRTKDDVYKQPSTKLGDTTNSKGLNVALCKMYMWPCWM